MLLDVTANGTSSSVPIACATTLTGSACCPFCIRSELPYLVLPVQALFLYQTLYQLHMT